MVTYDSTKESHEDVIFAEKKMRILYKVRVVQE